MKITMTRMPLPVPPAGTGIGEAGDAYVASLDIGFFVDDAAPIVVDGTVFEEIMSAIRLRHLVFHPRTRSFLVGSMKASSFVAAVDRYWASIDSFGPRAAEIADTLATAARADGAQTVSWNQVNG